MNIQELIKNSPEVLQRQKALENEKEKIAKLEKELNDPVVSLRVKVGSWSMPRRLIVSRIEIMLEIVTHTDGCDTCKKRVGEVSSRYDRKLA